MADTYPTFYLESEKLASQTFSATFNELRHGVAFLRSSLCVPGEDKLGRKKRACVYVRFTECRLPVTGRLGFLLVASRPASAGGQKVGFATDHPRALSLVASWLAGLAPCYLTPYPADQEDKTITQLWGVGLE